jgi:hypothetical protein
MGANRKRQKHINPCRETPCWKNQMKYCRNFRLGKLRKGHAEKLVQALEGLDLVVPLVSFDTAPERVHRKEIHHLGKNRWFDRHGSFLRLWCGLNDLILIRFPYRLRPMRDIIPCRLFSYNNDQRKQPDSSEQQPSICGKDARGNRAGWPSTAVAGDPAGQAVANGKYCAFKRRSQNA